MQPFKKFFILFVEHNAVNGRDDKSGQEISHLYLFAEHEIYAHAEYKSRAHKGKVAYDALGHK